MKTVTEKRPTWADLARHEPALREWLDWARSYKKQPGYRAIRVYLDVIKPAMQGLVGPSRQTGPLILQSTYASSLAMKKIYDALPDDTVGVN